MKTLKSLFGCEPPQFVRFEKREDRVAFFRRFCTEQPSVVAFLTAHGTNYEVYQTWTAISVQLAQKVWWNYIANNITIPLVSLELLERHYAENKQFVEATSATIRDRGMTSVYDACRSRLQPQLRIMVMAALFDTTQHPMISRTDAEEAPELVRDQNHMHA